MALFTFLIAIVALALLVVFISKKMSAPAEYAHLPSMPLWGYINDFLLHQMPLPERRKKYLHLATSPLTKFFVLGKWEIVVQDVDYARQIYTNQDVFQKFLLADVEPGSLSAQFFGINLVFSNGRDWKNQHKVISPAFQTKNLIKISSVVFKRVVQRVFDEFKKIDNKPIDIHDWTQRFALDAVGEAAFSFDVGAVSNQGEYVSTYNYVVKGLLQPIVFVFPKIAHLPLPSIKKMKAGIQKFDSLLYSIIDARKKKKEELGAAHNVETAVDLLDLMLCSSEQTGEDSYAFSTKELRDNVVIFFLAGHDTTANSLAIAAYFLAKYPEIQEKARNEVLQQYKESGSTDSIFNFIPTYEDQKQYDFITAIIKESLRLYPSVSILPTRVTSQETAFGDIKVPKGTLVTVNIFDMQRNQKVWGPDAEEFHPERFLPEDHPLAKGLKVTRNDNPYAFNAFGAGSRSCIGQHFSMIEQRMFLATLLLRYELSLPKGMEELRLRPSGLLSPLDLYVDLKRRF